jgi:hypothetical protein
MTDSGFEKETKSEMTKLLAGRMGICFISDEFGQPEIFPDLRLGVRTNSKY